MPVQRRKRASIAKKAPARSKSGVKARRSQNLTTGLTARKGRKVSARKGGLVKRIASAMSR